MINEGGRVIKFRFQLELVVAPVSRFMLLGFALMLNPADEGLRTETFC